MSVRLLLLPVVLALAGCASVGPDYAPPRLDMPVGWSQAEDTDTITTASPDDIGRWWKRLGDPLLARLVEEALEASPGMRLAVTRLREARARRAVALAGFFPSVSATGRATRSQSSKESGSGRIGELYNAGLDASWEVDVFGGVRRSLEAATADTESAEASLDQARVSLAAEVALNYVMVRGFQERLRIARDNLSSQSETLEITMWRAEAGLAGDVDVERARGDCEQTRARLPVLEASLAEARHALETLLGKAPGALAERLGSGGELPVVPHRFAVGIPADTLRQRPDIRAAERSLAAETARVGVAEAARYPSLTLSGSIGLEALTPGGLGGTDAAAWSLLSGITAPVFNAGKLRNQVEIQDAVRERAAVAYEQAVLTALREVEDALSGLLRSRERAVALTDAVAAASRAAELARWNYEAGLKDFQMVLETQRTLLSVEDSLAESRANAVTAVIKLYKALGGGWSAQPGPDPAL